MYAFARSKGHRIVIAPAILYEALRVSDPRLRTALAELMTRAEWKRLLPEAYHEAKELNGEARRLRPGWVMDPGDDSLFRRLHYDWSRSRGGFWDRARRDPAREAGLIDSGAPNLLDRARAQAREMRGAAVENNWHASRLPHLDFRVRYSGTVPGWKGEDVQPWRAYGHGAWTDAFASGGESHAYAQWLAGRVDLKRAITYDGESWLRFWLYDVDQGRMPRHLIRGTFDYLAALHRVSSGTPVDNQISSYLVDAEVFVTCDKVMAAIVEQIAKMVSFPIAAVRLLPADSSFLDALFGLFADPAREHLVRGGSVPV